MKDLLDFQGLCFQKASRDAATFLPISSVLHLANLVALSAVGIAHFGDADKNDGGNSLAAKEMIDLGSILIRAGSDLGWFAPIPKATQ